MSTPLQPVTLRERDALAAVCSKCGDGKAVRRALRAELKARGLGKRVRVVMASCLDVCPKRGVAVAVSDRRAAVSGARYVVVTASGVGCAALAAELDAGA